VDIKYFILTLLYNFFGNSKTSWRRSKCFLLNLRKVYFVYYSEMDMFGLSKMLHLKGYVYVP